MVRRAAVVFSLFVLLPATVTAQDAPSDTDCQQFTLATTAEDGTQELAEQMAAMAEDARDAGCYHQAERLFESAYFVAPRPRYIYERVLLQELLGQHQYAYDLLNGYRQELLEDPTINDLPAVELRLHAALNANDPNEPTEPTEPAMTTHVAPARSTVNTAGPIALGAAGAVSLGFAVYGLTAKCHQSAADGLCLEGSRAAVGPTTAYSVGAVIGLVGAAVWWVATTPKVREQARVRPTGSGIAFIF